MQTATPKNDLLTFLPTRALPKRLLRAGLALSSTIYGLRPDILLAKFAPGATGPLPGGWLGEGGPAPLEPLATPARSRGELFFIDDAVADPGAFWLAAPRSATVVCIPAGVDSWEFMAQEAEQFRGLAAIHIVSHGAPGALILNGRHYTAADLASHMAQLHRLGRALTKNGDILLYGCNTGEGQAGAMLVTRLADFTGADVAASSNFTGGLPGDDWNLEVASGHIETPVAAPAGYAHELGPVTVTSAADSGTGSLRDAITNASSGDTITFDTVSMGTSTITLTSGQLSIGKNLTINGDLNGDGTPDITIDANYHSRVLNITAGTVTLDGLIIKRGLLAGNGGTSTPTSVGGSSLGSGIFNAGNLTLKDTTVTQNVATGGGGGGGVTGGTVGGGGGGGSGASGIGGGNGGNVGPGTLTYAGVAGGSGSGGRGGSYDGIHMDGNGGTSGGGGAGSYGGGYINGGNGGTATSGITVGGGGGGSGFDGNGGTGGSAAAGIYNTGTITIIGSSLITNNIAAGGGGGGGGGTGNHAGIGGLGVGGIWNTSSGSVNIANSVFIAMTGNAASSGSIGSVGNYGSNTGFTSPTAVANISNAGGSLNTSYDAPPVVGNLNGDSVIFIEKGSAVLIDSGSNATVTDLDNTNLSGGNLTVSIVTNRVSAEDVLSIVNQGTSAGQIGISGSNVTFGGTTIGTFTGGSSTNDLVVSLNSSATPAATQALVRDITYNNSNATTPSGLTRTVRVTVNDGSGGTSSNADVSVSITTVNDPPTLSATGGTPTFTEGGSAASLFSGTSISTIEAAQTVKTLTLTVSNVADGSNEVLNIDGSAVALTNGNSLTTATNGMTASVSVSGGTATVTISKTAGISTAAAQTLVNGMSYQNNSSNPSTANRVVTLTSIQDNGGTSNGGIDTTSLSVAATVTVVAVDNAPVVTTSGGSAAFVAGDNTASTPVAIDSGVTVSDVDNTTLASGTVSITGNFHSGEDVLGFTNDGSTMGNISASYNSGTGVLTLTSSSATATLAQWQSALRAVTYTDTAVTPNNATRTISFAANDGTNTSATATRAVTVTDTDQTPIVTTTGGTTLNYLGGTSATTIDSGITVSDLDNTTQSSGTVSISSGFHSGDTLAFTNSSATLFGNIVGSYNAGTGVLTLTSSGATATDAQWANALSAVTFSAGTNVTPGSRTISYVTNDGTKNSAAATDTVAVTAPPIVTADSGSAAFVAGDNTASTPVTIDSGLTVTDASTSVLTSATVSITGNFHSGEDVLAFTNDGSTMGNIAGVYNATTGVLTLSSSGNSATLAQWQAALDAVKYTDTAVTPNNATRTISFSMTDANSNVSNTATRTVTVADTDQTPIVTTTGGSTNYLNGTSTIDGSVTVSDLDNTTQSSATVSITSGFGSGDTLAFTNNGSTMGNIAGSYNSGTGVLTLTSSGATATDAQWQNALKVVTFSSSSTSYGNRTLSFVVNDGTKNSAAATDTIDVLSPNPVVTTSGGSAAFTAGDNTTSTPVAIDNGLTVTDPVATTLASATVAITGNFHSGEDVLAFTNTSATTFGNIAASYTSGTGVLTLTSAGATATLAQWQAALRAVTYTDTAVTPNTATRTISFTVNDGTNTSNTATRTVTVADTDQTPIVTTTGGTTLNYLGGASAAVIDGSVTVSDLDNTTQSSATVSISSGFHSGDTLAFTNTSAITYGNIVGSYNSGTGVLTLTSSGATATDAQWASAFSAVTFSAGTTVTPGNRTLSFVVNDGTKNSAAATDTVAVTAPPIVTTSGGSAAFVAADNTTSTPVAVDPALTVTDASSTTLASATVSITGNFHSGEDVLAFTNTSTTLYGNVSASYNSGTGVLTLTSAGATATLAQWQAALRALTYTDTAVTPNTATRTISFTVVDGNSHTSTTATRTVTVNDTDQTPIVTNTGGITNYVAGTSAATIDNGVTVSDRDNATQASATVSISSGFHGGDTLAFANTSATTYGNISASYNSGTGVLTLTSAGATATNAQWASALSAVTFSDASSAISGTRTASFVISDGTKSSAASTKKVSVASVSASYSAPVPDGFAASATGGTGTGSVSVTVLTAVDFRTQATSTTPSVITVAGIIDLGATPVNVKSNKTIQGADANSTLIGNLNLASGVSNVIVRGLNLTNPGTTIVSGAYTDGGDSITIAGAGTVFITHCTFFDTANHAIEIMNGADNITVSWCEFYYTVAQTVHRFSMLIGAPGAETAPLHVTLHHNFWSTLVDQRMPVATFGYVHLYSDYFNTSGNTSGTVSSDQSQFLSERNVYTGVANPLTVQNVNTSLPIGRILALGNTYTAVTGTAPYSGADQVFTPTYSYEALPTSDVSTVISTDAGNIAGAGYTDAAVGSASITGPTAAVTSGNSFTLTAVPANFTPSTYQWRLGNQDISGATASTYTVSNTQAGNAGIYTVAIGLVSGDVVVSTPLTVTVTAAPPAPTPGSPPGQHKGGGAMSEWFLGALATLAMLRKVQQRRRART